MTNHSRAEDTVRALYLDPSYYTSEAIQEVDSASLNSGMDQDLASKVFPFYLSLLSLTRSMPKSCEITTVFWANNFIILPNATSNF
jgi:hypothetical protein